MSQSHEFDPADLAPNATIRVGCCGFGQDRRAYLRRLDFVEVQDTFFMPPRRATLERWRSEAPAHFCFAMRAWQLITHEPGRGYRRLRKGFDVDSANCGHFRASAAIAEATRHTLEVAEVLDAKAIVFETPAAFRPTQANRSALRRYFEGVPRDGQRLLVWHPRGLWNASEVTKIARDVGIIASLDPADDEAAAARDMDAPLYARLEGARYDDDALVRIGEACLRAPSALCVFNTQNMLQDATRLRALLELDDPQP